MANLSIGSRGDDVKKLQNALIKAGYNVGNSGADGIFGSATQAAVKAYQAANKLSVDGIAGANTLGSLLGGAAAIAPVLAGGSVLGSGLGSSFGSGLLNGVANVASSVIPIAASYAISKKYDPQKNESYLNALKSLEEVSKSTPNYTNSYEGELKDLYDKIVGREKFRYDIGTDDLYKQYAKQYADQGRMAMMDTMGQAAGLTGGYGSTYGQSVGQQQYDAYLRQLSDIIPQLEQRAYERYQNEGNDMLNQYAMLGDMADDEYAKYLDAYNRWMTERSYAAQAADAEYNRAYQQYLDKLNLVNNGAGFAQNLLSNLYQQQRDSVADNQWAQQLAYQQQRDAVADNQWAQEFALAQQKANNRTVIDDAPVDQTYGTTNEAEIRTSLVRNGYTATMQSLLGMKQDGELTSDQYKKAAELATSIYSANRK